MSSKPLNKETAGDQDAPPRFPTRHRWRGVGWAEMLLKSAEKRKPEQGIIGLKLDGEQKLGNWLRVHNSLEFRPK